MPHPIKAGSDWWSDVLRDAPRMTADEVADLIAKLYRSSLASLPYGFRRDAVRDLIAAWKG